MAWDLKTGKDILTLRGHTAPISTIALSRDGKRLFSGGMDNSIKIWNLEAGKEITTLTNPSGMLSALKQLFSSENRTGIVLSLEPSKDDKRLLSSSAVKIWDLEKGRLSLTLPGYGRGIWSHDGRQLYLSGADNSIKVWDLEQGKEIRTLRGHTSGVWCLLLSDDGKRLFSGGGYRDDTVRVWNLDTGKELLCLRGHFNGVSSLAISADGKRLFSGGEEDNLIKVWDLETGKEIITLRGHTSGISGLALSTDGKRLFSGSHDNTIKVWDLNGEKSTFAGSK